MLIHLMYNPLTDLLRGLYYEKVRFSDRNYCLTNRDIS